MVASIYTTVVVALERYVSVSKPFDAFAASASSAFSTMEDERRMLYRRVLAPVFLFSLLFNLPTFFEFHVINYAANETVVTGEK